MPLCIFDICGTLFRSNTTFDFVNYYHRQQGNHGARGFFYLSRIKFSPPWLLSAMLRKTTGRDLMRELAFRSFAGVEKQQLYRVARHFAAEYLSKRKIEVAQRFLREWRKEYPVLLVSGSIDPVVHAIANDLKLPYRSSILGYESGRCTGKLETDLAGNKAAVIQEVLQAGESDELWIVTDNKNDSAILGMADRRFIMVKNKREIASWHEWGLDCIPAK